MLQSKFVRYSPSCVILAFLCWSYYIYAIDFCFFIIKNVWQRWFYEFAFNFIYVLMVWSYFKILVAKIPIVPKRFKVNEEEYELIVTAPNYLYRNNFLESICHERNLIILTRDRSKNLRFCYKCKQIKPDRTHHCSICQTCILKMDHHCPWVGNCISFSNYKFFMLFLFYATLLCIFISVTILEFFLLDWNRFFGNFDQINVLAGLLMSVIIGLFLLIFLMYHLTLLLRNQTTLEHFRKPTFKDNENLTFNMGTCNNWKEIFGKNVWKWFLPIDTSLGDGINFPVIFIL